MIKILRPILNLFDGAAGGASAGDGGATGTASATAAEGAQAGEQALPGVSRRAKKSGGLESVVYGKQPEAESAQPPVAEEKPKSFEERRAQFRELIESPDFKDVYTAEFQKAFDRRFRDSKEQEERLAKQQPILEALAKKYGIEDGDVDKILQSIDEDDTYWQEAAEEAGMTVSQYKQFQKLQRDNKAFRDAQLRQQEQQAAQTQLATWQREADEMKADYPNFNLATEAQNPLFLSMLKSHVPVRHAYEVLHLDEIKGNVSKATEKRVMDGIRVKGSRPAENGVSSKGAITIHKPSASSLTKQDRAEIAKRVENGENIVF